eukprot:scaffold1953_cov176-Amphora_coffeaeformis.AAC.54
MDFASALEDLERTADQASSGRGGGSSHHHHHRGGGAGNRRGRPEDYSHHNRRNQRPRHHSRERGGPGRHHHQGHRSGPPPPSNPLEQMRRFGYRIEPPPVAVRPPQDLGQANRPFHIALLAICIDGLPYEHLWRAWAAQTGGHNTQVSLLVHAKYPRRVQSEFLKQRLLVHPPKLGRGNSYADPEYVSHQPNWGSVQITRAMLDLMRDALVIGTPADTEKDPRFSKQRYHIQNDSADTATTLPPVDKFIFISETCTPVATLAEFEMVLFGSPDLYASNNPTDDGTAPKITPWHQSWVHARNRNTPGTPKNKYERDQFGEIYRMVPGQYRWKADQWMALSRQHAAAVNAMDAHMRPGDQLWNSFTKISASDEMYFPTALGILQIIQDPKVVARIKEQQQHAATGEGNKERPSGWEAKEGKPKDEAEAGGGAQEAAKEESAEKDEKTEEKPEVTVESLSPTVLFKSVTFTDWSEGMRNPKSFFRGSNDLRTISRLARAQGSLLARKFILCPPSEDATGKAPEEMSGYITVDQWKQMIEEAAPFEGMEALD